MADASRSRNMESARTKGNAPLCCNCKCPACPNLAPPGGYYCSAHVGQAHVYPVPPQTHHVVGVSHNVSYNTTVGNPENGNNKL